MRKLLLTTTLIALFVVPSVVSGAPTGFMSSNVEHIATIPFDAGGASGARLVDEYLYVAGTRNFSIYDVSDPIDPQLVSTTPVTVYFANEDVDTNGEILLLSSDQAQRELYVYDVEDKAAPTLLATLGNVRDHNFACVLDCKWAYGTRGNIVDLRDPSNPKVAASWGGGETPGDGFDTDEVAPGYVLSAARTIRLMDARKPAAPKTLALGPNPDNRLIHSVGWPRQMKDRFMLVQGETPFTGRCDENSGAFMTWDASKWRKTHTFQMIDEYRMVNGTYTDSNPPAGAVGCTAAWFQEHPDFHNGGLVVSGYFEHGARFLEVDPKGQISEVGYFTPVGGASYATYWITDEIVYSIDLVRGIDILRFSR